MREILFRGKRCDSGEWTQGFYVRADHHWHNNGIHKDWIICGAAANGGWFALHNKYAVKTETVGQFTGLTDKNGKKIFEGDIVRCGTGIICKVTFFISPGVSGFDLVAIGGFDAPPPHNWALFVDTEVIGNIHDNPELLEVDDG